MNSVPVKIVSGSTPWALLMTVALLIAKYGFGVAIPLLWALAPLWLPIAIVLGLLIGGLLIGGAGVGALFGVSFIADWWSRRKWHKRLAK